MFISLHVHTSIAQQVYDADNENAEDDDDDRCFE